MLRCGREVKGCIWHHLQSPQMPKSLLLPSNSGGEWSLQPLGVLHKEKHRAPGYMTVQMCQIVTLKTQPVRFSIHTRMENVCSLAHSAMLITLEILKMLTDFSNKKTSLSCQDANDTKSCEAHCIFLPFKKRSCSKATFQRAWCACDDAWRQRDWQSVQYCSDRQM